MHWLLARLNFVIVIPAILFVSFGDLIQKGDFKAQREKLESQLEAAHARSEEARARSLESILTGPGRLSKRPEGVSTEGTDYYFVPCTSCSRVLRIRQKLAGTRGKCKHCGALIEVPSPVSFSFAEDATAAPATDDNVGFALALSWLVPVLLLFITWPVSCFRTDPNQLGAAESKVHVETTKPAPAAQERVSPPRQVTETKTAAPQATKLVAPSPIVVARTYVVVRGSIPLLPLTPADLALELTNAAQQRRQPNLSPLGAKLIRGQAFDVRAEKQDGEDTYFAVQSTFYTGNDARSGKPLYKQLSYYVKIDDVAKAEVQLLDPPMAQLNARDPFAPIFGYVPVGTIFSDAATAPQAGL